MTKLFIVWNNIMSLLNKQMFKEHASKLNLFLATGLENSDRYLK
ncbi:hypothetical protein AS4_31240 [Acinetobacter guillouiae]|nr:hypothetical protein AS4_31240 [Acinetobacter guillouiae]